MLVLVGVAVAVAVGGDSVMVGSVVFVLVGGNDVVVPVGAVVTVSVGVMLGVVVMVGGKNWVGVNIKVTVGPPGVYVSVGDWVGQSVS